MLQPEKLRNVHSHTLYRLIAELYYFAMSLTGDQKNAKKIIEDCIEIFKIQNRNRIKAHLKVYKEDPKNYAFKQDEVTYFFQRVCFFYKRDIQLSEKPNNTRGFYSLGWRQRAVLFLKFQLNISNSEIQKILSLSHAQFIEQLYTGLMLLKVEDGFEAPEKSELFGNTCESFRHRCQTNIGYPMNDENRGQTEQIKVKVPRLPLNTKDHFESCNKMSEAIASLRETNA